MIDIDLDDATTYEKLDSSGLRERLNALPEQCGRAWLQAKDALAPDSLSRCREAVSYTHLTLPTILLV